MGNGQNSAIVRRGLAGLACTFALCGSSIAGAAGYSAYPSALLLFACRIEWCAGSAPTVSGTNSLTLSRISTLETPVKWQSSFNVAGSRVWSKFIKFSRNGINVRVPLN
jgi:hypothetical protein